MKSSTFHRKRLSKDKMAALEQIVSERKKSYDNSPGVYVRNNKDRDLDLLWQGMNSATKSAKLSRKQILSSFVAGIVCALAISSFFNSFSNNISEGDFWDKSEIVTEDVVPVNVALEPTPAPVIHTERYTIRSGDTLESVVLKFYGVYDLERIKQIQAINNIKNPNKIAIGKTLVIPID